MTLTACQEFTPECCNSCGVLGVLAERACGSTYMYAFGSVLALPVSKQALTTHPQQLEKSTELGTIRLAKNAILS